MNPLIVVRILRWVPHTVRFGRRLDDCVALAVIYGPFDPGLPKLRLAHVFGRAPMPKLTPTPEVIVRLFQ